MTTTVTLGVAACGALGAVTRLLVHEAVQSRAGRFPFGTLVVNLSGSFALGLLVGAALSADTERLLGIGFLGGYTTFSTWMLETQEEGDAGHRRAAVLNIVGSLIAGVLAVWVGRSLA